MLPAPGFIDSATPPHAGGAVEVEEDAGAGAGSMLEDEVAIEEDGFDLGEEAVVAVEVGPAGLHHADLGLGKVMDDLHDPVRRGHEVGIEDGDEFAGGGFHDFLEGAGLKACAIGTVQINDGVAEGAVPFKDELGYFFRFVGGVVEDLDLEEVLGIFEAADGVDEAVDDELLVEDGQLHRDPRQLIEVAAGVGVVVLAVLEVEVAQRIAVDAVDGQHDHDREVGQQKGSVKGIPVVKAPEGLVSRPHGFEVMDQAVLGGEGEAGGHPRQPVEEAG